MGRSRAKQPLAIDWPYVALRTAPTARLMEDAQAPKGRHHIARGVNPGLSFRVNAGILKRPNPIPPFEPRRGDII